MVKNVNHCIPKLKGSSSNVFFCLQPKGIRFSVLKEWRRQKLFTFDKLKSEIWSILKRLKTINHKAEHVLIQPQLPRCEDLMLFFVIHKSEVKIFGYSTGCCAKTVKWFDCVRLGCLNFYFSFSNKTINLFMMKIICRFNNEENNC